MSRAALGYVWFGMGAVLWLFAVGGRWDLPFAPWLFSVFMLRFTRASRPAAAVALVSLASVATGLFWLWQLAVPIVPSSVVGIILYGLIFALPFILDRLLAPRLGLIGGTLLFPAAVAACEFATGVFSPLGSTFGLLATTQTADLPLLQVVSVAGPYAIGFLIAWCATVVNLVWERPGSWRTCRGMVVAYTAVLILVIGGGGLRLAFFPPAADYVRIAGLTPSSAAIESANRLLTKDMIGATHPVSQTDQDRLDPDKLKPAYDLLQTELLDNTRIAARAGARIVLWSENAAVLRAEDEPALMAEAAALARQEHIYIDVAESMPFVKDRTRLVGPTGAVLWTYDKAHPIPGMEVFKPGNGVAPVTDTPLGRLSNVICYDADFPGMMHVATDVMLIPGGDWPAIGRVHTLKMAGLRAIENGYSTFREDYDGLSALIDYQGHVLATQDTTTAGRHIMIADVPAHGVATLYRMTGDVFAWLCLAGTGALMALGLFRREAP